MLFHYNFNFIHSDSPFLLPPSSSLLSSFITHYLVNTANNLFSSPPHSLAFAPTPINHLLSFKVCATVAETGQPKWWEKNAPNMIDIHSMQDFFTALSQAGDRLVIVEFYGTWCASCRALYPKRKMTRYGTIEEAEESPNSSLLFVSQAKERIQTRLGTTRPWKEMIQPSHLRPPSSLYDLLQRIKTNAALFRANYVIVILLVLFLSLLWHPISQIVLVVTMVAWLFLYFLRDDPLVIFGFEIDERLVAISLLLVTVGLLFLTNVTYNVIVGSCVGLMIVLLHAAMRETRDLFSMDDEVGIITSGRGVVKVPLKHAASSSFTSS